MASNAPRQAEARVTERRLAVAFRANAREPWTVVDFKTDRVLPAEQRASYEEQVRLYARAIAEATGDAVRGVLLRV